MKILTTVIAKFSATGNIVRYYHEILRVYITVKIFRVRITYRVQLNVRSLLSCPLIYETKFVFILVMTLLQGDKLRDKITDLLSALKEQSYSQMDVC